MDQDSVRSPKKGGLFCHFLIFYYFLMKQTITIDTFLEGDLVSLTVRACNDFFLNRWQFCCTGLKCSSKVVHLDEQYFAGFT